MVGIAYSKEYDVVALWAPRNDGWCGVYKINRPSHLRRAIWFFRTYSLTSQASPNDIAIVIIIVIIIGEAEVLFHNGGIIAQTYLFFSVDSLGWVGQVEGQKTRNEIWQFPLC